MIEYSVPALHMDLYLPLAEALKKPQHPHDFYMYRGGEVGKGPGHGGIRCYARPHADISKA
jgi:hypothetical protein